MDKYPFLFNVTRWDDHDYIYEKTLVIISCPWSMTRYNHNWWGDKEYEGKTLFTLDIDISEETYEFSNESDALEFIKNWWKNQTTNQNEKEPQSKS